MEKVLGYTIQNSDIVCFEFNSELYGRVIKMHIPEEGHGFEGSVTYDVLIVYRTGIDNSVIERMRLRDVPGRCLIKIELDKDIERGDGDMFLIQKNKTI